jgi:hypothetical protein
VIAAALMTAAALACPGAPVHHGAHRGEIAPWVAAGDGARAERIDGFLYTLAPTLGDARVRDAAGLTVYAGELHKVAWLPRRWSGTGRVLAIAGRRVGGSGSFRATFPRALAPQFFPSGLRLPTAGCWRLTLTTGSRSWTLYVRAIEPPAAPPCDATPVSGGRNPVDPFFTTWIAASPRSVRIFGAFSVSVPGVEGAAIYAGGKWPGGANTKVLWLVERPSGPLQVVGTRLDGLASYQLSVRAAASPSYAYPSIPEVPEPGCWLLTLRTSGRGGVLVMRALAP